MQVPGHTTIVVDVAVEHRTMVMGHIPGATLVVATSTKSFDSS